MTSDPAPALTRSHWAWGFVERFPDADRLQALARRVGAVLGTTPVPRAAVPEAQVRLPPPRLEVPGELAAFATADPSERMRHAHGRAFPDLVRGFRGDFAHAPDLVLLPRGEDDVIAALAWAERAGVALVPFGGGTSVVGGVEPRPHPAQGAVASLDLRKMDRLLEVDPLSRAARLQAGATGPRIEAQLASHGLTLRHFPQSFEHSTLGGWIATRASGHFATLATRIDDRLEAVRMVTPRGVWQTRRLPGSGAGPDPKSLVLGSEGILGVITEAWVRVQPRPVWRAAVSVRFDGLYEAAGALRAVVQAGLWPSNCRVLDPAEALLNGVADDGSAVLLLGFESFDAPAEEALARAMALCAAAGGRVGEPSRRTAEEGTREQTGEAWRSAFLEGPYLQSALLCLGVMADTFETACTWASFEALHARVGAAVLEALGEACGGGVLTCRITHAYPDGLAPYFTFVAPLREGEERAQWSAVKRAATKALLAAGGTVTHHHAVGRTHAEGYEQEVPAPFLASLRAAKAAVDPAAVLNPGILLPAEG